MSDEKKDINYRKLFEEELLKTEFFMIRHETEFSPAGGISSVTKQERRNFIGGLLLAPYFPDIPGIKKAVKEGKIVSTGITTDIKVNGKDYKAEIWITDDKLTPNDKTLIPIIYLNVNDYFTSYTDPYYSGIPNGVDLLNKDSFVFGLAVKGFFDLIYGMGIRFNGKFVNGADWESVQALYLVKDRIKTSITLHNVYDPCLKDYAEKTEEFKNTPFNSDLTFLQIALDELMVATCVNRIFAWGLLNEPFHKKVMARHLLSRLEKVIGIDNGRFRNLSDNPEDQKILNALRANLVQGKNKLFNYKKEVEDELIRKVKDTDKEVDEETGKNKKSVKIQGRSIVLNDKTVFIFSGRLVSQKLHDVSAVAVREFLQTEGNKKKAMFFFAVVPGQRDTNRQRLLMELEEDFPENVVYNYAPRCPFFSELQIRADFNVLPSLYEPHGGAYEGFGIPIVNLIDGLLGQVHDPYATGEAARRTRMFHQTHEKASGLGFYASRPKKSRRSLRDMYEELNEDDGLSQHTNNVIFHAMVNALRDTFDRAIELHNDKMKFAEMTCTVLEKQASGGDWSVNLECLKRVHA